MECSRCKRSGHEARECQEKKLSKIWPGEFVFRGKIRTPDGSLIELEMPLGGRGKGILAELVQICALGGDVDENGNPT